MKESSSKSKTIARNTAFLYIRMLFLMAIMLYTSRVVLETLGVTDYGIYNVVGGFVSMFALISASLTSACSRFLNYEMGIGNINRQNLVFSTALSIQGALSIIIAIASEFVGVWYLNNMMNLPDERLIAANWCFQFSVLNFCIDLIIVPYNASIIAHEKMKAFAYVSMFQGLTTLLITILVKWSPIDRLVFYSFMLCLMQLIVSYIYKRYCTSHFQECKYKLTLDKELLMHMLSYSAWHLIGNGAYVLKTHGVNVLLNYFFGPTINAAKGISNQVDSAVRQFSGNFMMALNPQITKSYASGDIKYMFKLVNVGTRFSFYLLFILTLPILLRTKYILEIWLVNVPDYTVTFTQLTILCTVINALSVPLITAQNATGKVRNYQLIVGGILLLNLPICYPFLIYGFPPEIVMFVSIFVELFALVARMIMIPQTIKEFQPLRFVKDVLLDCVLVTIIGGIPLYFFSYYIGCHFLGFIFVSVISLFYSCIVIFCFGCNNDERRFLLNIISSTYNKYASKK